MRFDFPRDVVAIARCILCDVLRPKYSGALTRCKTLCSEIVVGADCRNLLIGDA